VIKSNAARFKGLHDEQVEYQEGSVGGFPFIRLVGTDESIMPAYWAICEVVADALLEGEARKNLPLLKIRRFLFQLLSQPITFCSSKDRIALRDFVLNRNQTDKTLERAMSLAPSGPPRDFLLILRGLLGYEIMKLCFVKRWRVHISSFSNG